MNKKGYIIPLLIVIAIIVGILSFWAYFNNRTQISKSVNSDCPTGIIPERLVMSCIPNSSWGCSLDWMTIAYLPKWADGTRIPMDTPGSKIYMGNQEGQNTHYVYLENLVYAKTPISSNGTIGKEIKYKISLVLDTNNYTLNEKTSNFGYSRDLKVVSATCRNG
jgi:hypothetical protein